MVSSIAVSNTITVQDSFLDLSSETLPTWDALKDMRLDFTLIPIQCVLALDCGFTIDLIICTTAKSKIL